VQEEERLFVGMLEASMSAEEGSHPKLSENITQEHNENINQEGGNIWVKLNESYDEKHLEMLQTVKSLRA